MSIELLKPSCHPEEKYAGNGLCTKCYHIQYRQRLFEKFNQSFKMENKKNYDNKPKEAIPDLKVEDHQQNYSDWKNLPVLITV